MFKHITAKLGNMRKPQDFIIQMSDKGNFYIQSDKSTGKFDQTGAGVLNTKGTYFFHLTAAGGAKPYQFPAEFVAECWKAFALKGDVIGATPETGTVYYGGLTEI